MVSTHKPRVPFYSLSAVLCALAYISAGACFVFDPSSAFPRGSDEYWMALANDNPIRQFFLLSFALAGIFTFAPIARMIQCLKAMPGSFTYWSGQLGYLAFGLTTINYVRILSGEPVRAAAFLSGDDSARTAISSFSIGLDTQGWILFGIAGLFYFGVNYAALKQRSWHPAIALLGLLSALLCWLAFAGLLLEQMKLVEVAAGLGGVVVGPLWWLAMAKALQIQKLTASKNNKT